MTGSPATVYLLFALVAGPQFMSSAPSSHQQAPDEQNAPQNEPKNSEKSSETSLTGCIDEQEGRYVLTDDSELKPLANLEAVGFPTEGFAKHVGHKVTVRGTRIPGDPLPSFKVRAITMVSETCAPQHR